MSGRLLTRRSALGRLAAALPAAGLARRGWADAPRAGMPPPALVDPARGPGGGWTIAVIPDTQNYAKYAKNQAHFARMTRWLAEHLEAWNIRAVLHEGDFVEQNDIAEGGGPGGGDQHSEQQWAACQRALQALTGRVPTIFVTGNHDHGIRRAEDRRTRFNQYFGLTHNPPTCDGRGGGIRVEGPPNAFGQETLENGAYEFKGPDGRALLILALEWGPRKAVVDWARAVAARPAYARHTGLLLVHDYLNDNNQRSGWDGNHRLSGNPHTYGTGAEGDTHDGQDLWQALVRDAPQIELVQNGHVMGRHVGYRADPNTAGRTVHQMLFNAQGFGGGSFEQGNGGDGWLRLLTFEPDGRTLAVRTFSPLKLDAGQSPWWDDPAWRFAVSITPLG